MLFLSRLSVKNGERLIRWQQECARTRPCWPLRTGVPRPTRPRLRRGGGRPRTSQARARPGP